MEDINNTNAITDCMRDTMINRDLCTRMLSKLNIRFEHSPPPQLFSSSPPGQSGVPSHLRSISMQLPSGHSKSSSAHTKGSGLMDVRTFTRKY